SITLVVESDFNFEVVDCYRIVSSDIRSRWDSIVSSKLPSNESFNSSVCLESNCDGFTVGESVSRSEVSHTVDHFTDDYCTGNCAASVLFIPFSGNNTSQITRRWVIVEVEPGSVDDRNRFSTVQGSVEVEGRSITSITGKDSFFNSDFSEFGHRFATISESSQYEDDSYEVSSGDAVIEH